MQRTGRGWRAIERWCRRSGSRCDTAGAGDGVDATEEGMDSNDSGVRGAEFCIFIWRRCGGREEVGMYVLFAAVFIHLLISPLFLYSSNMFDLGGGAAQARGWIKAIGA